MLNLEKTFPPPISITATSIHHHYTSINNVSNSRLVGIITNPGLYPGHGHMIIRIATNWLVLLSFFTYLALCGVVNWSKVKENLKGLRTDGVVKIIVQNWNERPEDFFQGIEEESWMKIVPLLSDDKIKTITGEELGLNEASCKVFAEHLPKFSNRDTLPNVFRVAVCNFLAQKDPPLTVDNQYFKIFKEKIGRILGSIPYSWVKTHGQLIMRTLTEANPVRLRDLNGKVKLALLSNVNSACKLVTLNVLLALESTELRLLTPHCLAVISQLGLMDLSSLMSYMREDIFSLYNGPLSKRTIQKLSARNVNNYGSLIKEDKLICTLLELHYLRPAAANGIISRCLYGYLSSRRWERGLGELWKNISVHHLYAFNDEMKPSLANIHPSDFDFMQFRIQRIVLSVPEVCAALGNSFWTADRIHYISTECFHRMLDTSGDPVSLGRLWENVNGWMLNDFTDDMKLSLVKIHPSDYEWMQSSTKKFILSVPEVCATLGRSFWTKEKMEHISPQCLYQILRRSEEGPVKLGELWQGISYHVLEKFTENMKYHWVNIHPEDYDLMDFSTQQTILSFPEVCVTLGRSFWTNERMRYISCHCLYRLLEQSKEPVRLGSVWKLIPHLTINGYKRKMFPAIKNIAVSDFEYIPQNFLSRIFSSDLAIANLPKPYEKIFIPPEAKHFSLLPYQFSQILKIAPNVAGQLLWRSKRLPSTILTNCTGEDIRSLKYVVPNEEELDWKLLFLRMEERYLLAGEAGEFTVIIRTMSVEAGTHFCHTIVDIEEYLSLSWLRLNQSEECRLTIRLDLDDISLLLRAPELASEGIPWRRMLQGYSLSDWAVISTSKRVSFILGDNCEFWATVDASHMEIIKVLDRVMLESIIPDCIFKLERALRHNVEMIPLLSEDAFSKHQYTQIPCSLRHLSPAQIAKLPQRNLTESWWLTNQELLEQGLSSATVRELKSLGYAQFQSLYEHHWNYIPDKLKNEVFNWHLEAVRTHLATIATKLEDDDGSGTNNAGIVDLSILGEMLGLIFSAFKNSYLGVDRDLLAVVPLIRGTDIQDDFMRIFEGSKLLKVAALGLIRDTDELRDYFSESDDYEMHFTVKGDIDIAYDSESGFNRAAILKLFNECPESFATPESQISDQKFVDNGGPFRILVAQLLGDIQRDLLAPETGIFEQRSAPTDKMEVEIGSPKSTTSIEMMEKAKDPELDDPVKMSGDNEMKVVDEEGVIDRNVVVSNGKFVWGIGKEAGFAVGLAFGKALQLEIRLPFALDPEFYYLFIKATDEAIEEYYQKTFIQDIERFTSCVGYFFTLGHCGQEQLLDTITRPESLRFTLLSTEAEPEKAKYDMAKKTNLWACCENEGFQDLPQLQTQFSPSTYIQDVLAKVLAEFKGFVREVIRGFGMTVPVVQSFTGLPPLVIRPFAEFLPGLLNAEPIRGEAILSRVKFSEDYAVECFVKDQTVSASEIISAFMLCLDERQLAHLVGIWTGASTLSLKYTDLGIVFLESGAMESYRVNFCDEPIPATGKSHHQVIASGEEYRRFFKKVTQKLLGPDTEVEPNCSGEGIGIIPARISTCDKSLMIYLQPAEAMLNSLVDLLHTSKMVIWDHL